MFPTRRTPSQDRGDVQAGKTHDKTPGFDPAAAPLETDAEAADTPGIAAAAPLREPDFNNQATFANAMRPVESAPRPRRNWPLLVIAAVVVVAAAIFGIAASMG
ncbi:MULTISPECIES: hypothetical protein [unclassified Mesorhizobium]|uniref:hypothetical protein n=1 Tax=unclassified Mesorhizobium TaxID=325217 RepID=UPI000FD7DAC4|nr:MULTISPECIES: hypothetical protein [unclassified Mesorhizobium]TGR58224.1 hypothetical protein EN842_01100 [bacterium M00.F.Ca.ET.199.01.1.1]TGU41668.1 hypothetical protein EN799_03715 [bacterium M00.F.Ca.ET.156.01.1.1]TGV89708.1 hypothetical protein EN792_005970 [Mesorhizobium sp. M00.F.Ca.ET.149.01.1.1]RWF47844.1 MAG: hypothetical protein EOS46_12010 [Mesorhizobium sp.]TGQ83864.1 hypothetical protein EN850_03760 [Mesorhizobium sp. M8A.F.Ca.ET.207.01.1.1]